MTSESRQSTGIEMTKPNCTIRQRQDKILDELGNGRYASRSEALRTAIEELHQTVNSDEETVYERIIERIDEMSAEIRNLREDLEDSGDSEPHSSKNTQKFADMHQPPSSPTGPMESDAEEIENDVYRIILEEEELTLTEIADSITEPEKDVRLAIESLVKREFVKPSDNEMNATVYRSTEVNV